MKKSKSSLDVLRLQWDLGSEIIEVMEVYPLSAQLKLAVLEVICADLKMRIDYVKMSDVCKRKGL